jgi:hypothetical protein
MALSDDLFKSYSDQQCVGSSLKPKNEPITDNPLIDRSTVKVVVQRDVSFMLNQRNLLYKQSTPLTEQPPTLPQPVKYLGYTCRRSTLQRCLQGQNSRIILGCW